MTNKARQTVIVLGLAMTIVVVQASTVSSGQAFTSGQHLTASQRIHGPVVGSGLTDGLQRFSHQVGHPPHPFAQRFGSAHHGRHRIGSHAFGDRRFSGFGSSVVWGGGSIAYPVATPGGFDEPSADFPAVPSGVTIVYATPPAAAPPSPTVPAVPATPPPPSVVEFSTGRYELRGDGVAAPYTWVWIPNPPSSPPATATAPSGEPSPRRSRLYRWTDEQGVVNLTDRLESVPPRYRTQVKEADS